MGDNSTKKLFRKYPNMNQALKIVSCSDLMTYPNTFTKQFIKKPSEWHDITCKVQD